MNATTTAFALALPVLSAFASAQPARGTTTLEQVNALPRAQVRVSCETAMWPSLRQVSRHTGRDADSAAALRARILSDGRRACAQGSTHVRVVFNPASQSEPVAVR